MIWLYSIIGFVIVFLWSVFSKEIYFYRYLILSILSGIAGLFFLRVFLLSGKGKTKKEKKIYTAPMNAKNPNMKIEVYTREEEIMDEHELGNIEKHINKEIENISELKPIDNLDFEGFAKHASNLMDNPEKYSDFITGWFFRGQVKRSTKAVEDISKLMSNMRLSSINARELQTEILKNKYLLKYQAMIAIFEAKTEYKEKVDAAEMRAVAREAEKNRLLFLSDFYKNAIAKDLTPSEKMLYLSQTPIQSSKLQTSELSSFSETNTFVNPIDVLKIEEEKEIIKKALRDKDAEYEEKIERNKILEQDKRIRKAQADLDEHTTRTEIGEDPNRTRRASDSKD